MFIVQFITFAKVGKNAYIQAGFRKINYYRDKVGFISTIKKNGILFVLSSICTTF